MLVVKHQHRIAVDRLPDRIDRYAIDRPSEVDPADFGDEGRINLPYLDGHATSSLVYAGEDLFTCRPSQSSEARRGLP